jgi:hypothetical protein
MCAGFLENIPSLTYQSLFQQTAQQGFADGCKPKTGPFRVKKADSQSRQKEILAFPRACQNLRETLVTVSGYVVTSTSIAIRSKKQ